MIQENSADKWQSLYLYTNEGSYGPLARIDRNGNQEQQHIYYFHTNLKGMPEELTDEAGEIVWECSYQLWGKPIQEIAHKEIQQNLRYQGQYLDRETGLHYNTFRYYDPDTGRFTQPDPIGLLGGYNLYQYAPNALTWIDPFGLEVVTVYHYTNKKGYNGIIGSGVIRASNPGERAKGAIKGKPTAVYVTKVVPNELKKSGYRGQMGLTNAKSTHYISFEIDSSKLEKVNTRNDVLRLYIEGDVMLRDKNNKLRGDVKHGEVCPKGKK
ncbi:RHS repeat-associated core domain-containing protein [Snodgrassella alvi]|uniref:RHS repeat-associated core domain-containing protein n=1 Tax=Snodgrassella alvi TaxID=1196083 RepID=UPI000A06D6E7|nr:RHS repeat-associated core domain-containing protein [Snodgrassella alvi]ORF41515.1 hypothetical protein BGI12_00405 [Snodgrassella alvi]